MAIAVENLIVACRDWQHPAWSGPFYPEDMPQEWQLDFYSTQFPLVMVSQHHWQQWNTQQIEGIAETLEDEEFGFIFRVSTATPQIIEQLEHLQTLLEEHFYSVYLEPGVDLTENDFLITHVGNSKAGFAWNWSCQGFDFSGLPVACLSIEELDLEQQKAMMTSFMQSLPEGIKGGVLVIDDPADVPKVKNLQVLAELMGY